MLYSLEDLETGLGRDVLAKGRPLTDSGALEPPNVQRGGELVTALIRGSGRQPLRVYARVREQPGGGVRIEGECSCTARRNCHHVAAVLFKALDWEQPRTPMAGSGWRGRGVARKNAGSSAMDLPSLLYLLLPGSTGGVAVETYAARRRSTGYGEVRRYTPAWALRGVPTRFLSAADLEILGRLNATAAGRVSPLEGELLADMLESGRCHAGDLSGAPLRPGAPRPARLHWRVDAAGEQYPEWLPDSDTGQLSVTHGLWYLDSGSECGPLETGLPAALIRELNTLAPALPEQVEEVREGLKHRFPEVDFPLPEPLELEQLPQVPPTLCLRLEMVEEGRRILLFSQFAGMLALIAEALREHGLEYLELTGNTRDRATPVERFQAGEVPLFLISLKAGGVGLNLTAADTVIHYDPWWNPAVESQATDRAHRIGQEKPVFVYKLFAERTVEERIQELQTRKQALADSLFDADGAATPRWSGQELDFLFEPL